MQKRAGTFIAIEGTDGAGKGTQFELLCERLRQAGYDIATFDFPQYNAPSSYFVKQYLNGEYGTANDVGPYTASLFYALDRYEAAPRIAEALNKGQIVVSNRFTGSSMGHQGTKFRSPEERRGFFIWLDNLEFEMLRIPRPDISFVLRVPAEVAEKLIDKKGQRGYTDKKRDIHEADRSHLERSVEVYDDLTQLFPKDFQRIDCVRSGKLLEVDTIQNMLWEKIAPLLPPPPQLELASKDIPSAAAAAVQASPSVSGKAEAQNAPAAKASQAPATNAPTAGQNTGRPAPQTAGQSHDPVRSFREVTAQHFVVPRASQLLAQHIQAARPAYAGEINPNLDYTQKDVDGNYRYYLPAALTAQTAQQYNAYMGNIFELYTAIVKAVAQHLGELSQTPAASRDADWQTAIRAQALRAARPVLPVAATNELIVLSFGQSLETLVTSLLSSDLPELQETGRTVLRDARELSPNFLEHMEQGNASANPVSYRAGRRTAVEAWAQKYLPEQHAGQAVPLQLNEVWPRNELDILADILYPHSNLPLADVRSQLAAWPYDRKLDLFEAAVGTRTTRKQQASTALEKIRYNWDIVTSYAALRSLQRQALADGVTWQKLTPRHGYEVPQLIEDAGVADEFEQCFDLSLELYSLLQQAGHPQEAQYATLSGHRLRWKLSQNALEAIRLLEQPIDDEAVRGLQQAIHAKLHETHPLIAEIVLQP